jgi:hypothetical protein
LNDMLDKICKRELFGKVLAHVHRIEWQVTLIEFL